MYIKPSFSPDVPFKEAEELDDTIVHSAFTSDSKDAPKEQENAVKVAFQHLMLISEYSIKPSPVSLSMSENTIFSTDPTPVQFLSLTADNLSHNNNTNHVLSEAFSACPNKIGEGGNGPSHCPLPKVMVRFEDNPQ